MSISEFFYRRKTTYPDDGGKCKNIYYVYRVDVVGQHYLTDAEGYSTPQYTCQISLANTFDSIAECEGYILGALAQQKRYLVDFDKPYSCISVSSMGAPGKYPLNTAISEKPLFVIKEGEVVDLGKY